MYLKKNLQAFFLEGKSMKENRMSTRYITSVAMFSAVSFVAVLSFRLQR